MARWLYACELSLRRGVTRLSGLLITSLALYTTYIRGSSKDLKTFDLISSACWVSTGLLAVLHRHNFKNYAVDAGIQFGLAGAILYQGLTRK